MSSTQHSSAILRAAGVGKRFGGVRALEDVDLELRAGEIRAVIGENGAGKSTLMRIVSGELAPDGGRVEVDGAELRADPGAAREAGIALVHQELSLVPTLSVAENVCLADPPRRAGLVSRRRMHAEAAAAMERLAVDIDVAELVERLPLAQRQFVEIAKALRLDPRILILDEPTAALTPSETDELIGLAKRLAAEGTAILFISHRIPEIFALCSAATVLRDGRKVADVDLAASEPDELVRLMVGRGVEAGRRRERALGEPLLRVEGLATPDVEDVSFEVRAGEILGIGGLVGAGRTEAVRAAIGLDPTTAGGAAIETGGRMVPLASYRQALANGVAFVPEDRRGEGLALAMSIAENVAMPSTGELSRRGVLTRRSIRALGDRATERLGIRSLSPATPAGNLSGGNQQKVVLGKWLVRSVRLLVLDEPTRGVDVGAKAEVHELVRAVADAGAGVIVISSDLPELLGLADRVLVMKDGRVTGELDAAEATEESVMGLATRGGDAWFVGAEAAT